MVRTVSAALVLGGAACVWEDVRQLREMVTGAPVPGPTGSGTDIEWPGPVIAVNDVGSVYLGRIDHWVSLHPWKFATWRPRRSAIGGNENYLTWTQQGERGMPCDRYCDQRGAGSSGLLAVRVAEKLGATRIVLCGVPMDPQAHYFDSAPWMEVSRYKAAWEMYAPELREHVRSMSGWTRNLLGTPSAEWLGLRKAVA